jgi:hypothetical protein
MSYEEELIEQLASFAHDPLGFVMWAFPWGEAGTELANFREPYRWQIEYLEELGHLIRTEKIALMSTTSGHGTGKSALNGMETWWAFSTREGTRGVITANTENQLRTKTWVEMAKWHRLFIARSLFKYTATSLFSIDDELAREWRVDMVPWSEKNTEAFAGLHNAGGRIISLFDEASAIPDIIWETMEGALTDADTEILWSVKGNPTRNQGRFRECFPGGKFAHRWSAREIDSRSVPGTNKQQIQNWIDDYGIDSDFVRIRVLGKFPRADQNSFIPLELARAAAARIPVKSEAPVVIGVDVGRFGDDPSVIYARQGDDAKTRTPLVFQGLNTIQLADKVMNAISMWGASTVFVDEGGIGAGVVDVLELRGAPVIGVQFGGGADSSNPHDPSIKYANKRAEMWGAMRHALRSLSIVDEVKGLDASLTTELAGPTYDYQRRTDALVLEAKADMKSRGLPSPNVADALALTFAYPSLVIEGDAAPQAAKSDYNPFDLEDA